MDDTLASARADVDGQVQKVRQAVTEGPSFVHSEAAILEALVARETAVLTNHIAGQVMGGMEVLRRTVDESADTFNTTANSLASKLEALVVRVDKSEQHLASRIDAFTEATRASSDQLATWTKVMAIATTVLAVFTLAQVVVAWLH